MVLGFEVLVRQALVTCVVVIIVYTDSVGMVTIQLLGLGYRLLLMTSPLC